MASVKTKNLKRKSPSTHIFEVAEADLSSENTDSEEPDAKIQKTQDSDVSDSRVNKGPNHNSDNDSQEIVVSQAESGVILTGSEGLAALSELSETFVEIDVAKSDHNASEEDGEVLDSAQREPSIIIKFRDRAIADNYKLKFLRFMQSFIECEVEVKDENLSINVYRDTSLDFSEWVVVDQSFDIGEFKELFMENKESPKAVKKKKKRKKHNKNSMFVVDPSPNVDNVSAVQTMYSTKFLINDKSKEVSENKASASICFNCDKNHSLKDCPEPKNFIKININRQKLMNKHKTSRYHLEEDQKFSHLAPGKISQNLRTALGLRKDQIPKFVYQMRLCGYPPGWLEEAKFIQSDLAMFDIDGNNVKSSNLKNCKGLDPARIVNYPGFNVPMEKEFKDEYKFHHVPPYSDDFSKAKMIEFFKKQCLKEEDNLELLNMDITNESCDGELVEEKIENAEIVAIKESLSNAPSPSLNDLETEKQTLLKQLTNPDETLNSTASEDDSNLTKPNDDLDRTFEANIKTSTFGTPILKSNSPYNRLPNADNFSKDVSPVINFENLPNSTGKYEQMTNVLQKVRDTMKDLTVTKS